MNIDVLLVVMLPGVPRNIDYHEMKRDLLWLPGVEAVHSLNIWALTMDKVVVSVHLAVGMLSRAVKCAHCRQSDYLSGKPEEPGSVRKAILVREM